MQLLAFNYDMDISGLDEYAVSSDLSWMSMKLKPMGLIVNDEKARFWLNQRLVKEEERQLLACYTIIDANGNGQEVSKRFKNTKNIFS